MQEEKIRLLMALTRFTQPELLRETLERSLSSDVRSQDTISVVSGVAANLDGRDLAWEFVKDQWPEFDRRYGGGGFGLMRLVSICSHFTTQEQLADVEAFSRTTRPPPPSAPSSSPWSGSALTSNGWNKTDKNSPIGFVGKGAIIIADSVKQLTC